MCLFCWNSFYVNGVANNIIGKIFSFVRKVRLNGIVHTSICVVNVQYFYSPISMTEIQRSVQKSVFCHKGKFFMRLKKFKVKRVDFSQDDDCDTSRDVMCIVSQFMKHSLIWCYVLWNIYLYCCCYYMNYQLMAFLMGKVSVRVSKSECQGEKGEQDEWGMQLASVLFYGFENDNGLKSYGSTTTKLMYILH